MRLGINGRFLAARLTGVQRFAHGLCHELYERADVVLLVPADARLPSLPPDVRVVRGSSRGQLWEQLELPRLADAQGLDALLHPANTVPRSGAHNVVIVHDVLPLTHPRWFSRRYVLWHRHVVRPAIARARTVFTCSNWSAAEIARTCNIEPDRIRVITQGLAPFDAPADADAVAAVRERLGIVGPYLLSVGLGDERKNITLLLRVMERLSPSHPELRLLAVGANNARIHRRGDSQHAVTAPSWLHTLGNVDDATLRALYTGATALCFPSLAEGFGRPPLEALACGAPSIAGDYATAHEILGNAVPILPHDTDAWVAFIDDLLRQPRRREELVACGATLLPRFQWSLAADQVLSALEPMTTTRPAFA